jgi:integrase
MAKRKLPNAKQGKVILNARNAAGLELPDGKHEQFFWDAALRGFGVRLRREGEDSRLHRCWVAGYQSKGRYRRMTIADYEKLTAEQARAEAKRIFGKVAHGEDPMAERRAQRLGAARSLRAVIDDYLAMKAGQLRPASLREARRYLTGPYFKSLHSSDINAIVRGDVAVCLNRISQDRGATVARAARAALAAFFTWAMRQGLCEVNVVAGTEDPRPANGSRERVLSDSELGHVWRAAGNDSYGAIIKLLICFGMRRKEAGGLRRGEIDLDAGTITLPAGRVKNKHQHVLPITPLALSVIKTIPERDGRDFLFGDRSSAGFTAWSAAKDALDLRLKGKVMVPWRLHDIRRSVSTKMHDLGVEPHYVEAVLNHYSGHRAGVAGMYNYAKYPTQIRAALALWNDHLRSLIEGGERKVVKLSPHKAASFPQRGA